MRQRDADKQLGPNDPRYLAGETSLSRDKLNNKTLFPLEIPNPPALQERLAAMDFPPLDSARAQAEKAVAAFSSINKGRAYHGTSLSLEVPDTSTITSQGQGRATTPPPVSGNEEEKGAALPDSEIWHTAQIVDTVAEKERAWRAGSNLPIPLPVKSLALVPNTIIAVWMSIRAPGSSPAKSFTLISTHAGPFVPFKLIRPRRHWRRDLLLAGIIVLLLVGLGLLLYRPILDGLYPPTATVTITPASQRFQQTYQVTAVVGQPDTTKGQVEARELYADSPAQSQTVKATGHGQIGGTHAQGYLIFYNTSNAAQTIAAGTVILSSTGIAVVNDDTLTIPALNPAVGVSRMTDTAHTINVGSAQNIPAYTFNTQVCCNGTVDVTNTLFSGGQDGQSFTYVQQSDIDGAAQALSASLTQQTTARLQGQIQPNEKLVGAPQCMSQITSDHQASENVSTFTVSVAMSCVGEVYDAQAAQAQAMHHLSKDASTRGGLAYMLVGSTLTQVMQATSDAHGTVTVSISAVGVWVYQFTNAQRARLASLVSGKSNQDARHILLSQSGVQTAAIFLTGVGVTNLPTNLGHIVIHVETVQGLSAQPS